MVRAGIAVLVVFFPQDELLFLLIRGVPVVILRLCHTAALFAQYGLQLCAAPWHLASWEPIGSVRRGGIVEEEQSAAK